MSPEGDCAKMVLNRVSHDSAAAGLGPNYSGSEGYPGRSSPQHNQFHKVITGLANSEMISAILWVIKDIGRGSSGKRGLAQWPQGDSF